MEQACLKLTSDMLIYLYP